AVSARRALPRPTDRLRLLCVADGAANLGLNEILLRAVPGSRFTGETERLSPFALTLPEVREVLATVAVAHAPEEAAPTLPGQDLPTGSEPNAQADEHHSAQQRDGAAPGPTAERPLPSAT